MTAVASSIPTWLIPLVTPTIRAAAAALRKHPDLQRQLADLRAEYTRVSQAVSDLPTPLPRQLVAARDNASATMQRAERVEFDIYHGIRDAIERAQRDWRVPGSIIPPALLMAVGLGNPLVPLAALAIVSTATVLVIAIYMLPEIRTAVSTTFPALVRETGQQVAFFRYAYSVAAGRPGQPPQPPPIPPPVSPPPESPQSPGARSMERVGIAGVIVIGAVLYMLLRSPRRRAA
jgi:hypothetical protein